MKQRQMNEVTGCVVEHVESCFTKRAALPLEATPHRKGSHVYREAIWTPRALPFTELKDKRRREREVSG